MADVEYSDIEENSSTVTFLELILDLIEIFEPELCLTQEIFWRQLPRTIEEMLQVPQEVEQEWETIKILFKRLENYFQTHKDNCFQNSLTSVMNQLKKVMVSGFKMCFSAKLQSLLITWYENSKDTLKGMEDLFSSLPNTTHTSTSTTIAPILEDPVDVTGEKKSRKRKTVNLEDAFLDLVDAEELETSTYPTGNVSYYISQRKDGELSHRILMDK